MERSEIKILQEYTDNTLTQNRETGKNRRGEGGSSCERYDIHRTTSLADHAQCRQQHLPHRFKNVPQRIVVHAQRTQVHPQRMRAEQSLRQLSRAASLGYRLGDRRRRDAHRRARKKRGEECGEVLCVEIVEGDVKRGEIGQAERGDGDGRK